METLEQTIKTHEKLRHDVEHSSSELFAQRQRAVSDVIDPVEDYVNLLANSPKEFARTVGQFRIEVNRFEGTVKAIQADAARSTKIGSSTGAAGAIAGVGVAALGPSAAMAVATTFGTASTGAAISTLSGAAATNAALAWLGGGAIASGGGGMAAGTSLLALAGPVGWGIGGMALVGSGWYLSSRNKKHARQAAERRIEVEAEVRSLRTAGREIEGFQSRTKTHVEGCLAELNWLQNNAGRDYVHFGEAQKHRLAALINHIRSLSELLNKEVAL